ncbi:MAG: outer membrane beta-barrel protein [Bryobacteraceae bacterium]
MLFRIGIAALLTVAGVRGQVSAGGGIGLSVLSRDSKASPSGPLATQYDAGKGALAHAFAGWRVHEYIGVQGAYVWTRNAAVLRTVGAGAFQEQRLNVSQNQVGGDFLLFFRDSKSWIQPFLSVGLGITSFSGAGDGVRVSGAKPGMRVAAGVDVWTRGAWGFRYAFLETIGPNPILPGADHALMTFKNQFGVIWRR